MKQITATYFAAAHKQSLTAREAKKFFHPTVAYALEHYGVVQAAAQEGLEAELNAIATEATIQELEVQFLMADFDAEAAALLTDGKER